ncbi:hypothetical protein LG943_15330 [Streptomonospora sp. S1-112]|uniref:Uncharacterized protein n=1 Tax=Streptomonospora mangrovi TaxID=2883123 RepID=A0A9X3SHU3_9ACTN|nr:hypothetical protein [Streptomonospora mangrovi]MDA0565679.1 hypothetical protein [Streptomonospora mangrovi]
MTKIMFGRKGGLGTNEFVLLGRLLPLVSRYSGFPGRTDAPTALAAHRWSTRVRGARRGADPTRLSASPVGQAMEPSPQPADPIMKRYCL